MVPKLQKMQDRDKSASRVSFPGCLPNKNISFNKPNKGPTYMEATASSKAKIFRSSSMGEGINAGEEQKRLSNLFRPLSTTDLTSENRKYKAFEENLSKHLSSSPTHCKDVSTGQQEGKTKTVSPKFLSDKHLMPPPTTFGVMPRLKKKAKSINNLPKKSRKEELNSTVKSKSSDPQKGGTSTELQKRRRSTPSSTCGAQDDYDAFRRASIAECLVSTVQSDCPTNSNSEDNLTPSPLSTSPTPCSSNEEEPSK